MRAYLDTNVLVAASVKGHPHHFPALELVKRVKAGEIQGCVSTHGIAELYAVLTRAPFSPRVRPMEASRIIEENILCHFELCELTREDYKRAIGSCAKAGRMGGVVYDALHLECAERAGCDWVFTFNVRDFRALATGGMVDRVSAP